jgi:hypothetical protein
MATVIPQSPPASRGDAPGEAAPGRVAGDEVLLRAVEEARAALWRAELSRTLLKGVVAAVLGLIAWFVLDQWIWSPGRFGRLVAFSSAVAACGWWAWTQLIPLTRSRIRADYAAYSLEADLPELQHSLTSYISLRGDGDAGGLRGAVLRSMANRAAGQIKRNRLEIPSEATGTFRWWMLFAASLAAIVAYGLLSPKSTLSSAQRLLLPFAKVEPPTRVTIRDVAPGDCQTLTQRPLEITARVNGLAAQDEPQVLFGPGFRQREPMRFDDSTGLHRAAIVVTQSTQYRVVGGDAGVGPFEIVAIDVPVASIDAVEITPPRYTGSPPRTSTGGAIQAEENSRVTIASQLNRPMVRARLEFNPRPDPSSSEAAAAPRGLAAAGGVDMQIAADGLSASATFPLRLPRAKNGLVAIDSYRVRVWDADGNDNPEPIIYPVRITPDLAPEVQVITPREPNREVPLNGQLLFEISAVDPDFGLRRVEWVMRRGADPITTTILWSAETGVTENQLIEHRFVPAQLGFRVGDTVYVKVAASDNREDIEERPEPNRSETPPIELKIVEPRQLPPPSAPENGLSEPEEQGTGDNAAGGGGQSGDKQSDQAGGQSGGAGESGSGDSQDSPSGNQAGGQGDSSGDASAQPPAGTDGSGQAADSQSNPPPDAGGQPGGMSDPNEANGEGQPAGEPGEGASAEGAMGNPDAAAQPADSQAPGDDPSAKGESIAPAANGDQPPGEPAAGDGQPENASNSGKAPQHDGDAFERIREFLEGQRGQAGDGKSTDNQQPAADPNQAHAGEPSGQSRGENAGTEPKDQPTGGKNPAAQRDPAGAEGTGEANPDSDGQAAEPPPGGTMAKPQGQPGSTPPAGGESAGGESAGGESAGGEGAQSKPQAGQDGTSDAQPPRADAAADQPNAESDEGATPEPAGDSRADRQGDSPASGQGKGAVPATPPNPSASPSPSDGLGGEQAAGTQAAQPAAGDQSDKPVPQGNASGGDGGMPSDSGSGDGATPAALPPDPVDVDYARQATDLVLDYLNQNRETPDPELLERLNWTPEELRDFTERWMRNLKATEGSGAAADPKQVENSLKSLGIRKPNRGQIGGQRDAADDVRGLRDSGGRLKPPSIYKDAFEAFRRGVNRPASPAGKPAG